MSNLDAKTSGQIFRKDHPMILAARRELASLKPVRLAYNASGYKAGALLARNTVSGLFQNYVSGGASGTGTAACVLFAPVEVENFSDSSDTALERGVFGGEVFQDLLVISGGASGSVLADLSGRTIIDATGVQILKF